MVTLEQQRDNLVTGTAPLLWKNSGSGIVNAWWQPNGTYVEGNICIDGMLHWEIEAAYLYDRGFTMESAMEFLDINVDSIRILKPNCNNFTNNTK